MEILAFCPPQAGQHHQVDPRAPRFKHTLSEESPWMDGPYNWVSEDMVTLRKTEEPCAINVMHNEQEELKKKKTTIINNNIGGVWMMLSIEKALSSLEEGTIPSVQDIACIFHKCRKERNLAYARRLHAGMCKCGLEAHASLGNHLVVILVEVGSMHYAQQVFDRLVYRNEHSWNALITGYVNCGKSQQALDLYQKMQLDDSAHPCSYTFVALLRACAKLKDMEMGRKIHTEIARNGSLQKDPFVGSTLVSMYAKCGSLAKAHEVLDNLPHRNVVSWNALISGYAEHGCSEEALNCLDQMQHEGISPNVATFSCGLKACGSIGAIDKGRSLHAEIASEGLERDIVVGSALVDMYAKCGLLAKAQGVFDKLSVRNIVSWTALIAGYADHGCGDEALNCFKKMQHEGISPDAVVLACSLKACGSIGAVDEGQELHVEIARKGLERDLLVGNSLVHMYAKCGSLAKAQEVFDKLPVRNIASWTALIAGYGEHGHGEEALNCLEQMQHDGLSPDAVTFVCSLKACSSIEATEKGQDLHADIARKGLERDLVVGSTLVDMYVKCGLLVKAREVFDKLPIRNIVSWTALIAGYTEHGRSEEALDCFEQMQREGVSPNAATYICSLKACGSIGDLDKGCKLHAEIASKGFERDLFVGSTLVDMYAKCGSLAKAQEVLNKFPVRNVVSWNALVAGYAEHGCGEEALNCFEQMQHEGISQDAVTFVCSLKACGSIRATDKGRELHAEIVRRGLESDHLVGSTLVDMYAKCGSLAEAQEVFDRLPVQDVVSWNALITGYAEHGCGEEALRCFEQMQGEGVSPNDITLVCSLKACGSIGAADKGQELHAKITREGLERDLVVGSTLVDMYAKCGLLAKAQEIFDKLPVRNIVSWTALIAGYAEHGCGEEALNCFEQMQCEGVFPDAATYVCCLKACGSIGATGKGQDLHAEIAREGLERDCLVGSTLVDMYAKCGYLAKAQEVFDKLQVRDVVSWNALITGYAQRGESKNIFHIFDRMLVEGLKPNQVTFLGVLKACNHAGLVAKGQMYFEAMSKCYGIIPSFEHHTCLVDLLGRAGQLDKAVAMIKKMPFHCELLLVVWHTVLAACQKWGDVELGRQAFELAVQVDEKDAAAYVCMSNIYAGMQVDMREGSYVTSMKEVRTTLVD